jgi:hypothetical protein
MYENRKKKLVKNILNVGREERVIEGVNLIKVHYMHAWKYHNETPLYN